MIRTLYILLVISVFSCKEFDVNNESSLENIQVLESKNVISNDFDFLPTSTTNAVYKRNTYVFSYSETHEQSEWVAYYLDSGDVKSTNYDRPFFEQDPLVKT